MSAPRYFAIVPAAGSGSRMGAAQAKQYLPLAGRALIEHTLAALCAAPQLSAVVVVLAPDDREWAMLDCSRWGGKLHVVYRGGETRAQSVLAGLEALRSELVVELAQEDWVLVHDAARPCLSAAQLERLIAEIGNDEVGGLLAVPVADTLKRADPAQRVAATVARDQLWQAQTPQQFRAGLLRRALQHSGTANQITDEASAVEALGLQPRLVMSDASNLKVTYPQDLLLAAAILRAREENAG
ncbi:MAG: 2-C-methyl-D-erythritol 4-phosphate cytidylyltransferase [Thauera sp.]|jgi:2-C-methyl-D-erythritol 4-phosphate cytidylyltransferase|nr:2-C-methyl-D-erythritol 4-phosphate cytidylyltransferase [Thauera sp.]